MIRYEFTQNTVLSILPKYMSTAAAHPAKNVFIYLQK